MKAVAFTTPEEARRAIPEVVRHLRAAGLLAYPTETVYGLGSRPDTPDVQALASLKGRAAGKPFLLLVSSREMAEAQGLAFTESARALARAFWPGPGAEAVLRDFRDAVTSGQLMVLDGGVLGNRPPSTVVDCTGPQPRIIRPGAVSLAELRAGAGMLAP